MTVMLDTDVCVEIIRRRDPALLERLASHTVGEVGISAVTLAELEYGISRSSRPAKNREALTAFVGPLEIAPFDSRSGAAYGPVRAALEKKGETIGAMDVLIAAHAIGLGVILATRNVREFRRVPGLRVEDWG